MKIEIWSDIACPWCYIGKRRLEKALKGLPQNTKYEIHWRSYQISPSTPMGAGEPIVDFLVRHKGISQSHAESLFKEVTSTAAGEGLDFRFDIAINGNTFDAHRLVYFGSTTGKGGAIMERLLSAYFERGESIADLEKLVAMAEEVGLDGGEARKVLECNKYSSDVRTDQQSARKLGISGVPLFLVDGKHRISGAQSSSVLAEVFKESLKANENSTSSETNLFSSGTACNEDGCVVKK